VKEYAAGNGEGGGRPPRGDDGDGAENAAD
jgi:hypothetical protein